jgi:PAS domain S-box-containing protein
LSVYWHDITERKRAEEKLRRSEANLAEGQRICHTGSWTWNVTNEEMFCSQELFRIFGLEAETAQPTNETFLQLIHPEDENRVRHAFNQAVDTRTDYEVHYRIVRADGELRYIHSLAHPVFNESRALIEYVGTVVDETQRKVAEDERSRLLRRVMSAHEEERRRIARDLHDEFGQQLTAMTLKLRMLKERWSEQKELRGELEALEANTRQLDQDVNLLVWELRPTSLEDLSLQVALTKYTQNWSRHFGIHVELHASGIEEEPLPPEIVSTLYRIAQEALSNVAKHALATRVDVILECRADDISLIIEDNGLGFEPEKVSGRGNGGFGLTGIRERAALVGGIVEIESRPGGGVTVIVRIPTSTA